MKKENILEAKNITVSFGGEKVINNISFDLKDKENLVVVGPNGAGKSVLLKTLLGTTPYEGQINWKKDIKIGYVPQRFVQEKDLPLTVEDFFKFKKISINQIHESLCSVGLHDLSILKKKMGVISSGQLQRILIAWGLINNPDILLFDEPTTGIDIEGEETIYNLIAKLEKEKNLTMILITHDLNIVYKFADSVLCLNKKMICYGPAQSTINEKSLNELYGGDIKLHKHTHEF